MIQVTSKDLEKVRRLHRRFPKLIEKTFPATVREETKEWRRDIRMGIISANWPRQLKFGGSKPIDLTAIRTSKFKGFREIGISIKPRSQGPSALFERGSKGVRKRKGGASTGIMPANPVYGPHWLKFKSIGRNDIQQSFIKASIKIMDREIRKSGLK